MGPRKQRILATVLVVLAIVGVSVGAVFAYLSATAGPVNNSFTPDQETKPSIVETFGGVVKENVSVDVGDPGYAVYVRVAIIVTWENGSDVLAQMPVEGTDYRLTWNDDHWLYNPDDGFYYLKTMIHSGTTDVLIDSCSQSVAAPTGYQLHVEIIAQTIQALGTTDDGNIPAVTDAWGIRVDSDGKLFNTTTVAIGESFSLIADAYGVNMYDLAEVNGMLIDDTIHPDDVLYLPNLP